MNQALIPFSQWLKSVRDSIAPARHKPVRPALTEPDYQDAELEAGDDSAPVAGESRVSARRLSFKTRVFLGLGILAGLFLLYRFIWLAAWYWPYHAVSNYLRERLPLAAPWLIESAALLVCALLLAQAGAILSFIMLGRNKRLMIYLVLAGAAMHGALGWYSYNRVAVDEHGKVRVRVVERPDGSLKIIDRDFDPETGRPARWATENDLTMLDLERRGLRVKLVGPEGPFRSPQGTINVYYTRNADRIVLYTGPRHREVSGDMPLATEEVLQKFLQQHKAPIRR